MVEEFPQLKDDVQDILDTYGKITHNDYGKVYDKYNTLSLLKRLDKINTE